jgi:hypothetical protein
MYYNSIEHIKQNKSKTMRKIKDKKIEIREIVYCQDDEKSFGDIFVYEPENVEEQNLGNLFIVGELKDLPRNSSYIVNLLASKIKKEFYSDTKRTAEESLEAALSQANKTLSEIADSGSGEYVGRLSMICGTYRGNKFYLSQVGKIRSLLIRNGEILDIMKEESGAAVSPKRVFNNIASGELATGDMVIFATSGLFNVFSLEKLRQLGSSSALDDFSSNLQEEIEKEDNEIVSALIMKIEGEKKSGMNRVKIAPEKEIEEIKTPEETFDNMQVEEDEKPYKITEGNPEENLSETEEEYESEDEAASIDPEKTEAEIEEKNENMISTEPSEAVSPKISEEKADIAAIGTEAKTPSSRKTAETVSLSDIIKEYEKRETGKEDSSSDSEQDRNIERIVSKKEANNFEDLDEKKEGLGEKFSSRAKNYFESANLGEIKSNIADKFKKTFQGEKEYKLKSAQKFSFIKGKKAIVVIVVLLAVVAGAYYFNSSKNKDKADKEKLTAYQSMLSDSKSKMDQGEVDLISGTQADAGKLFVEAKTLALKVKNEYGDGLSADADTVIAKAQIEIDKIDKIVKVDTSQTVATFENANIKNLVEINGVDYAIDGKENSAYKVDAKNGKLTQIANASDKIGEIKLAQNFQNQEILLSDGSGFSSFSVKSGTIQKLSAKLDSSVADFAVYTKNIYLLSPSGNQIYKYQRTSQGLDNKTAWLKSGDIKNAISFTIDQYVYILTSDGQVKKYFTGTEFTGTNGKKFEIQQPSEKISAPGKIYTLMDQEYLYITEPGKNRILIFDKTSGTLVKQLVSTDFSDLRDISVDAKETTLLALVNNKIVKVNLTK